MKWRRKTKKEEYDVKSEKAFEKKLSGCTSRAEKDEAEGEKRADLALAVLKETMRPFKIKWRCPKCKAVLDSDDKKHVSKPELATYNMTGSVMHPIYWPITRDIEYLAYRCPDCKYEFNTWCADKGEGDAKD